MLKLFYSEFCSKTILIALIISLITLENIGFASPKNRINSNCKNFLKAWQLELKTNLESDYVIQYGDLQKTDLQNTDLHKAVANKQGQSTLQNITEYKNLQSELSRKLYKRFDNFSNAMGHARNKIYKIDYINDSSIYIITGEVKIEEGRRIDIEVLTVNGDLLFYGETLYSGRLTFFYFN